MKRKAEAEPEKEEQPATKEQKTTTEPVKFKRPLACCVFLYKPFEGFAPYIGWRWLSGMESIIDFDPQPYDLRQFLVPSYWLFAPQIEPLVYALVFGRRFRGLARIVAQYAEIDTECAAVYHISRFGAYQGYTDHKQLVLLGGPFYNKQNDVDSVLAKTSNCRHEEAMCRKGVTYFTIPYPTTENVL